MGHRPRVGPWAIGPRGKGKRGRVGLPGSNSTKILLSPEEYFNGGIPGSKFRLAYGKPCLRPDF